MGKAATSFGGGNGAAEDSTEVGRGNAEGIGAGSATAATDASMAAVDFVAMLTSGTERGVAGAEAADDGAAEDGGEGAAAVAAGSSDAAFADGSPAATAAVRPVVDLARMGAVTVAGAGAAKKAMPFDVET